MEMIFAFRNSTMSQNRMEIQSVGMMRIGCVLWTFRKNCHLHTWLEPNNEIHFLVSFLWFHDKLFGSRKPGVSQQLNLVYIDRSRQAIESPLEQSMNRLFTRTTVRYFYFCTIHCWLSLSDSQRFTASKRRFSTDIGLAGWLGGGQSKTVTDRLFRHGYEKRFCAS